MTSSTHNDPGYDEMAEWVRCAEIDLGRSQSAYQNEGAMPIQGREHPDANLDGFIPPDEVDWNDVLDQQIGTVSSYEPTEEEKASAVADIHLHADEEEFEGSPAVEKFEDEDQPSLDQRFEYHGLVQRWPHLADVFAAIEMSLIVGEAEGIGEDMIALETLRCAKGSDMWFVDDLLHGQLLVAHDPSMNHPLSAKVAGGDCVVWVYERDKPLDFPNEPIGYIHDGYVFRRPKVWHKA